MTSAQLPTLTVDEILEEACARNTPAELHYESARGDRVIFRVRLIALTEKQILADTPAGRAGDRAIPAKKPITVHFQFKGERRQFGSAVVASDVEVRLNDSKIVRGIALRKPSSTAESQRRTDFRQSLAACDPIAVTIVPPASEAADACLLDAPRATGQLVQISAGGAAVTVKRVSLPKLQSNMPFFLSFELPEVGEAFCMLAFSRHIRELHQGESLRVGWEFTDWGARTLTVDQRRIARFVATYQRKTLQHRT